MIAYEDYLNYFKQYIDWMNEQIKKNDDFIVVRRLELIKALNGKLPHKKSEDNLYRTIKVILFDEGMMIDKSHYMKEEIYLIRRRRDNDVLTSSYDDHRKIIKKMKLRMH